MMEVKSEFKKTEAGYIPVDWTANSLKDISEINKGKQLSKLDMLGGEYYVLNGGQVPSGYHNTFNTPENTISISEGGNSCGFVKFNKEKFWSGGHNYTLSLRENINILFLYHYLKYKENIIMSLRVGSGLPNIQKKALQNFYISLPPLKEQQKIAEILSTVDEQIEQTDQLIEKTKELKKGLMQQLLTKGINHTKFKNSELGEIPVEWAIEKLKDLSDNMYQGINTVADKIKYEEEGVQILQAKHITKERFNYSDARFVSNQTFEKYKNKFNPIVNDILLSNIGTIGKTVRVSEHRDILIAWNIFLIRPKHEIDSIYLLYIFKRLAEIDYYDKFLTGNATKFINKTIIENILVPKPPLKEQQKIADILSSVDEDIEGYEEEKAKYEELKKGLMQQLLTGKTRVKVD